MSAPVFCFHILLWEKSAYLPDPADPNAESSRAAASRYDPGPWISCSVAGRWRMPWMHWDLREAPAAAWRAAFWQSRSWYCRSPDIPWNSQRECHKGPPDCTGNWREALCARSHNENRSVSLCSDGKRQIPDDTHGLSAVLSDIVTVCCR